MERRDQANADAEGPEGSMWQKKIQRFNEATERARKLQSLYRRQGALSLQEKAEAGMQGFDPRQVAAGGGASLAATRRLGQMGNIAAVTGEIEGRMKSEAVDPDKKRETLRGRMTTAAAAMSARGATKAEMRTALMGMAGGDPELLREAASIASASGRTSRPGTLPGYLEDVGSFLSGGRATT
tara:strand:+ start:57 stop:605 length:549 start_codon:yes stop_codon:yes gene_type:complete